LLSDSYNFGDAHKIEMSGHGPTIQSLSLAVEVISPKDPSLAIAALPKDFSLDSQGLVLLADRNIADNCSVTTDGFKYARLRETWMEIEATFRFFSFFFFFVVQILRKEYRYGDGG
jgi:hypothetical protein